MTMKLKKTLQIILALCLGLWMISCQQEHIKLTSPNGKLSLEFTLDEEGAPRYCLRHAGKNILLPSRLGLVLKDAPDLLTGFVLKEVKHDSHNDVWQPVWGEEAEIVNHYNELRVCLKEETSLERELNIIFRLFDDGMGFRYEFPRQQQLQMGRLGCRWWKSSLSYRNIAFHSWVGRPDGLYTGDVSVC